MAGTMFRFQGLRRRAHQLPSSFTLVSTRLFSLSSSSCPFSILGIPKSSSYEHVKKAFIKLALEHHPDTAKTTNDLTDNNNKFHSIRQAFESIHDDGTGRATLSSTHHNDDWTEESLETWFHDVTGKSLYGFHIDSKTRRQVTEVASTHSPGGLDKGGMWEMANSIAKQSKNNTTNVDPLQVTSGNKSATTTSTRRRRRKK